MWWSSADTGAEACHERQRSVLPCPTPKMVSGMKNVAVSKSLEELPREVARVQGQPAGKEEDSEIGDENGPPPVPKSARVVPGRRHHGRSFALAARRHYQIALGTFLKFVKKRALPLVGRCPCCAVERLLCPGSSASPWFTASCCRDRWPSFSSFGSRKLPRFH